MPDFNVVGQANLTQLITGLKGLSQVNVDLINSFSDAAKITATSSDALDKHGNTATKTVTKIKEVIKGNQEASVTIKSLGGVVEQTSVSYRKLTSDLDAATAAQERYNRVVSSLARQRVTETGRSAQAASLPALNTVARQAQLEQFKLPEGINNEIALFDKTLSRVSGTLINLALYRGFNAISQGLSAAVVSSREYSRSVAEIRTITQDSLATSQQYGEIIARVSHASATSFKDVAAAAYDAASNQVASGAGLERFLTNASNLALVTKSNIKDSGNVIASAVNAFGSSAGSQEEIVAKLFRTVDLGRISIEQLTTSLGNVSSLAATLGVSFDELLALLSTLTRRGISTSQSVTLINAAMEKLLKPTKAMQEAFDELGYASGQSAISTDGFAGTLTKIIDLADKGKIKLSELFNQERSLKLASNFKAALGDITTDLDKIQNKSSGTFNNAVSIVKETPGFKIEQNIQTLKNASVLEFGNSLNRVIAQFFDLTKSTEDFRKSLSNTADTIVRAGAVVAAFVVTSKLLAVANQLGVAWEFSSAQAALATARAREVQVVATNSLTAAETRLSIAGQRAAALRGASGFLSSGALGVLLTGATVLAAYNSVSQVTTGFNEAQQAVDELVQKIKNGEAEKGIRRMVTATDGLVDNFKKASAVVGSELGQAIKQSGDQVHDLNEKLKQNTNDLKEAFVGYLDVAKNKVRDLDSALGHTKTTLDSVSKAKIAYSEAIDKGRGEAYQQYGTDEEKIAFAEKAIKDKIAGAKAAYAKGTPEEVADARKALKEAQDDAYKLETLRTEQARKSAEQANRLYPGALQTTKVNYDLQSADKQAKQIGAIGIAQEDALKLRLEKQKIKQEEEVAKAKEQQKKLEDIAKHVAEFNPFDDTGKAKKEFADRFGNLDSSKVTAKLTEFRNQIQQIDPDKVRDANLLAEINKRQTLLTSLLSAKEINETLLKTERDRLAINEKIVQKINDAKKALREVADASKDAARAAQSVLQAPLTSVKDASSKLEEEAFAKIRRNNSDGENGIERGFIAAVQGGARLVRGAGNSLGIDTQAKRDIDAQVKQLEEAQDLVKKRFATLPDQKTKTANGIEIIDPKAIDTASKELENFINVILPNKLKTVGQTTGLTEDEVKRVIFGPAFDGVIAGYKAIVADLKTQFQTITARQNDAAAALQQVAALSSVVTKLEEIGTKYKGIGVAADDAADSVNAAARRITFDSLRTETDSAIKKINELVFAFDPLTARADKLKADAAEIDRIKRSFENRLPDDFVGPPQARAFGGPIGRDNIPAWLSAGEYVMNPSSTAKFYSQIVSMNNEGRIPQHFSNGGPVTNMGGVTINVNESNSPGLTARAINGMLRREARLGR